MTATVSQPVVAEAAAVVEQHAATMRDGVALATDVYRPPRGRVPTVLLRTPYDRTALRARTVEIDPLRAVRAGYGVALQDLRGRHGSGGAFSALTPDVEDGADAVAWIRAQEWSDGRVMTVGASYDGCVQFQAARTRPDGLVALAPTMSGDLRTIWLPGGGLRLAAIGSWVTMVLAEALAGELPPSERDELEALLDAPLLERFHAFLAHGTTAWRIGAPLRHWVALPPSDPYWTTVTAVPERPLPAIHTTGHYDLCGAATLEAYERWSARAGDDEPQLLTLGPWTHDLMFTSFPELALEAHRWPDIRIAHERQLAFFATVLDGAPGRGMAPVTSFVLGRNRWHEDACWPPADVRPETLALARGADLPGAGAPGAGGALVRTPPASASVSRFAYDPLDPVPTHGGAHSVWHATGPLDQAAVEARPDVRCFTTTPFAAGTELAGTPRAQLVVGSSAPATAFVVKLTLVTADGRSLALANGSWSGRLADLPAAGDVPAEVLADAPLGAAGPRRCEIALGPVHVALAAGERLRLQVASSSFPDLYPHPNTEHELRDGPPPRVEVAQQTLLLGAGGSALELPVRGGLTREPAA